MSSLLLIITHCKTDAFTSYQQEEFLPSEYLTPYDGNNVKMENPIFIKQEIFDDDFSANQHKSKLLQSLLRCEIFFFSSRSLKMREKCISFAQFVYFLRKVCLLFKILK